MSFILCPVFLMLRKLSFHKTCFESFSGGEVVTCPIVAISHWRIWDIFKTFWVIILELDRHFLSTQLAWFLLICTYLRGIKQSKPCKPCSVAIGDWFVSPDLWWRAWMGLNICIMISCLKEVLQIFCIGGGAYRVGALSSATMQRSFQHMQICYLASYWSCTAWLSVGPRDAWTTWITVSFSQVAYSLFLIIIISNPRLDVEEEQFPKPVSVL